MRCAVHRFVGAYNITDSLTVAVATTGVQEQVAGPDLDWDGIAAYVNYAINGQWRYAARGVRG
jgi:hypothetical protein